MDSITFGAHHNRIFPLGTYHTVTKGDSATASAVMPNTLLRDLVAQDLPWSKSKKKRIRLEKGLSEGQARRPGWVKHTIRDGSDGTAKRSMWLPPGADIPHEDTLLYGNAAVHMTEDRSIAHRESSTESHYVVQSGPNLDLVEVTDEEQTSRTEPLSSATDPDVARPDVARPHFSRPDAWATWSQSKKRRHRQKKHREERKTQGSVEDTVKNNTSSAKMTVWALEASSPLPKDNILEANANKPAGGGRCINEESSAKKQYPVQSVSSRSWVGILDAELDSSVMSTTTSVEQSFRSDAKLVVASVASMHLNAILADQPSSRCGEISCQSAKPKTGLPGLPMEIQLQTLESCLVSDSLCINLISLRNEGLLVQQPRDQEDIALGILLTCRLYWHEGSQIFWKRNWLCFHQAPIVALDYFRHYSSILPHLRHVVLNYTLVDDHRSIRNTILGASWVALMMPSLDSLEIQVFTHHRSWDDIDVNTARVALLQLAKSRINVKLEQKTHIQEMWLLGRNLRNEFRYASILATRVENPIEVLIRQLFPDFLQLEPLPVRFAGSARS